MRGAATTAIATAGALGRVALAAATTDVNHLLEHLDARFADELAPREAVDLARVARGWLGTGMPSLALDAPATFTSAQKREFANRLGAVYAETMQTELRAITVVVHDRGEDSVWRCGEAGATPGALLMCDIREGRPAVLRERLCHRMIEVCESVLGVDPETIKIEFTQHAGDEMFHPHLGGFNRDWSGELA